VEYVSCNLCGADRTNVVLRQSDPIFGSPEEFSVVRCHRCELLYLNPRPTAEEISRYYPQQYFAPGPTKTRSGLERALKQWSQTLKRWIREDFYGYPSRTARRPWRVFRKILLWPERMRRAFRGRDIVRWAGDGRLLDVGCGPGANLKSLQEQGWDVYGIELSETAVARARALVGDRIHCGTLDTSPFEDESFDVVLMSHSLEHLYDPVQELQRVRRLLKPQGCLIIAVPNAGSLEAKLFGGSWIHWDPPRHLYHFSKKTLTGLVEQAGFQVLRLRTGVGHFFFMATLERVCRQTWKRGIPARTVIETLIAKPLCLLSGHAGFGTEITVHAAPAGRSRLTSETSGPGGASPWDSKARI
jgi:SAM-dependent methyltransferase